MSEQQFIDLMHKLATSISDRPVDRSLEQYLNAEFSPESQDFTDLTELCVHGDEHGWLMQHRAGDIKFGRAIKPGGLAGKFSVDVVKMEDIKGPHHVHTKGEIGAIMPISGNPEFDGRPAGWYVYEAGSAHFPTVQGGSAYVLYLLPDGAIEFTGK